MGLLTIVLLMLACCIGSGWFILKTLGWSKKVGRSTCLATLIFAWVGLALGLLATFHFQYYWKSTMRVAAFPFPIGFLLLEDGHWTDFIPKYPVQLCAIVTNVLMWIATFLGVYRLLFRFFKPARAVS